MADNGYKINKSLNLNPQATAPANPVNGDMYFDGGIGSIAYYKSGAWAYLDAIGSVVSATDMTSALFTPTIVRNSMVRMTGSGGNLHGLSASFSGKRITLYNNSSGTVTVRNASASEATANNRILTPIAADMTLIAGEIAEFVYDATQTRWLLVSVGSGAGAYLASTTTTNGSVRLNHTPVDVAAPKVVTIDAGGLAIATGLTRSTELGAGTLAIGTGANDQGITIGRSGQIATIASTLDAANVDRSGNINIGMTTAANVVVGRSNNTSTYIGGGSLTLAGNSILMTGPVFLDTVDRANGAAISIGASTAGTITIGRTGQTLNLNSVVVTGDNVSVPNNKNYKYVSAVTRSRMFWPCNSWLDSAGAVATVYGSPLANVVSSYIKYAWGNTSAFDFVTPITVPAGAVVTSVDVFLEVTGGTVYLSHADGGYADYKTRLQIVNLNGVTSTTALTFNSQGTTSNTWLSSGAVSVAVTSSSKAFLHVGGKVTGSGEVRIRLVRVWYTQESVVPDV